MRIKPILLFRACLIIIYCDREMNHKSAGSPKMLLKANYQASIAYYWRCFINIISHGMLLVAILADATNLFNYSCNVMRGRCQNVFWCELSNIFITVLKFILAIATFCWLVQPFGTMLFCCSSKENLMRDKSSLKGTYLRYYTLSISFLCLLPAIFGIGDERIQTLTWNQRNADNTYDSQLVFNYELKPALPTSRWVLQWEEHSMDFYDISSTMDNRSYNYNETKDFLEKYHCEILIPTNEAFFQRYDIVPLFGPFGRCMRYTASIPNCSPP